MEKSAELVQYNNPFDVTDHTKFLIPAGVSAYSIIKEYQYDRELYDIVVSLNNEIVECDFIVEEGQIIEFALVPKGGGGGKQILMIVAMIAVAIIAPYAAGYVGLTMGGVAATAIGQAILVAGFMAIGGMIVGSLFKPSMPSSSGIANLENSPTYGWNVAGNSMQQGNPIPILYGKMRIVPQYIGKSITSLGDKQYLSVLTALCEGPIDSIYALEINDAPISSFTNILIETRLGTNDQGVIPLWVDTWTDQSLNKKLTNTVDWVSATTKGDAVTELSINLLAPQGLWYANDGGGLDTISINLDIEYRIAGGEWAQITTKMINGSDIYVDHNPVPRTTYTYFGTQITHMYPDTMGPFDVYRRSWVSTGGKTGYTTTTFIETIASLPAGIPMTTIVWQDNQYPNPDIYAWNNLVTVPVAQVTMSGNKTSPIRATYLLKDLPAGQYEVRMKFAPYNTNIFNPVLERPTGSRYGTDIVFEFLQEAISDDFTYPDTALLSIKALATDQLSGGFPKISAIVERISGTYGRLDNPAWASLDLLTNSRYGAGVSMDRIDFTSFQSWADYCTAENFTVNIYLDQLINLVEALRLIGQNGRGSIIQYGSTFTALVDRPNILPVQGFLFSMGNIIQNSFSESFLPLKDRANIIEVTYYDELEGYTRTPIEVSQGNYDLTNNINKASIDLVGCTNKTQAMRQAKYHINQNRYLTITASWEASIDAIHCRVGDIVNIAHDVPQWGYSGRIVSATSNTIVVDRDDLVLDIGKMFYIQISNADTDTQLYKRVINISGDTLTLESSLSEIPSEYSVYSFGEVNRHAKQMRILSLTTSGDLKRKITAIEYNPNVYLDTTYLPSPVLVSDLATSEIQVYDYMHISKDGVIETIVSLSWRGVELFYPISYLENDGISSPIFYADARSNSIDIFGLKDGVNYTFYVGQLSVNYTISGKTMPPPMVENITVTDTLENIRLKWDYPYTPVDFKEFVIPSNLYSDVVTKNLYVELPATKEYASISIYSIDTTGNKSDSLVINHTLSPLQNIDNTDSVYLNNRLRIMWNSVSDSRATGLVYEIRRGVSWGIAQTISVQSETFFEPTSNGMYWISALYKNGYGVKTYSLSPYGVQISGAVLVGNVIASFDDYLEGWQGTKTGTVILDDNVFFGALSLAPSSVIQVDEITDIDNIADFDFVGGSILFGTYDFPIANSIIGDQVNTYSMSLACTIHAGSINSLIDNVFDFDSMISIDEDVAGKFSVTTQISTTIDGVIYSDWANFIAGDYLIMGAKFRIVLTAQSADILVRITEHTLTIDVPDHIEKGTEIIISSAGVSIAYSKPFHTLPNTQITIIDAIDGDTYTLTNTSITGFYISITNGGLAVERQINYISQGY